MGWNHSTSHEALRVKKGVTASPWSHAGAVEEGLSHMKQAWQVGSQMPGLFGLSMVSKIYPSKDCLQVEICFRDEILDSAAVEGDSSCCFKHSEGFAWNQLANSLQPPKQFFPRASERRVLLKVGSAYFHIFTSSHLHIFTTSHPHIFTSSRPHIITSSHLHILTSSHLHIFTSSYPHICTSSHLHIHIFTSSHLHIFTSSHPHILTFSLSFSLSLSLSLSLLSVSLSLFTLSFFFFLSLGRGQCRRRITKRQPSRTKRGSSVKNWGKIAISTCPDEPFTHETRFECQKLR